MPPDGFGPNSQWGAVRRLALAAIRRPAWTAFEVVNEPNGQLWPQRSQVGHRGLQYALGCRLTRLLLTGTRGGREMEYGRCARAPGTRTHRFCWRRRAPTASPPDAPRTTTRSHNLPTLTTAYFVRTLPAPTALEARRFAAGDAMGLVVSQLHRCRAQDAAGGRASPLCSARRGVGSGRRLDGGPELWCTEGGCRLAAMQNALPALCVRPRSSQTEERKTSSRALVVTESLSSPSLREGCRRLESACSRSTRRTPSRNFDSGAARRGRASAPPCGPSLKAWSGCARVRPRRRSSGRRGGPSSEPASSARSRRERMPSFA